jgi:hypothetical protein
MMPTDPGGAAEAARIAIIVGRLFGPAAPNAVREVATVSDLGEPREPEPAPRGRVTYGGLLPDQECDT